MRTRHNSLFAVVLTFVLALAVHASAAVPVPIDWEGLTA